MLIKKTHALDLPTSSIQGIHQDTIIDLIIKAVCTSEKSIYFYDTARRHIPESCHLHIVISSQVLFHDGSLLLSKVQYTTVEYN
jgi:hypothetical protein